MKSISEIAKILTSLNIRKSRIFGRSQRPTGETYYERMFDGVISGELQTDADAANALYGSTAGDVRYTTLKSRLREVLLTALLSADTRHYDFDPVIQTSLQCQKNILCARLLIFLGGHNTAMDLIRKSIRKATKFHLTAIALECALILQRQSVITGSRSEFRKIAATVEKHLNVFNAEIEADRRWTELSIEFSRVRSFSFDTGVLERSNQSTERIKQLRDRYASRILHQTYFRMQIMQNQIARDYKLTLAYCDKMEEYYQKNPLFSNRQRHREIASIKMNAFIFLRDFDNGYVLAQSALRDLFDGNEASWFLFNELFFLLCMHTGNYQQATEIFLNATQHKNFAKSSQQSLERWRILEAFLRYVLAHTDTVELAEESTVFKKRFNLYKFLNEVPIYQNDKQGTYVPILIAHILFLLDKDDILSILDHAETIRQYSSRYLRHAEYTRTNTFLRMLRIMINQDFNYQKTVAKTSKLYTKLLDNTSGSNPVLEVTEIIPFEVLWDMVLKRLKELKNVDATA